MDPYSRILGFLNRTRYGDNFTFLFYYNGSVAITPRDEPKNFTVKEKKKGIFYAIRAEML
jgi:hypothetical protein